MRMAQPARYDDTLAIDCWLEKGRSRALEFGYRIVRPEEGGETLIASGTTTLVSADDAMRPKALPEEVRRRFHELCPRRREGEGVGD